MTNKIFSDKATWDGGSKSAISVRDGVLEYLGSEIGEEPATKVFTVYRSPATIARVADAMKNVPLTDNHVDIDSAPKDVVGKVKSGEVIDFFEDGTDSRLAIKNIVDISKEILDTLDSKKRELSLGYSANLIPHDKYDFEQRDIEPHHLAIVDQGRCGHGCKFLDKGNNLKLFIDEDGKLNLEKVVEIALALPDALKQLPIDELQKVLPGLQDIVDMAKSDGEAKQKNKTDTKDEKMAKKEVDKKDVEEKEDVKDESKEEANDECGKEKDVKDEDKEEDEDEKEEKKDKKKDVKDTAEFKDAVAAAVKLNTAAIVKAIDFVDEGYDFLSKSTDEIMSDAVATRYEIKDMNPEEIRVAFKLLKKESNYKDFGDNKNDDVWSKLGDKELGA